MFLFTPVRQNVSVKVFGFDLAPFYGSIKLLMNGERDIYSIENQKSVLMEARKHGYSFWFPGIIVYHPFLLLLLLPFSFFEFPIFAIIWFLINIVLLIDLLRRIYQMGGIYYISFFLFVFLIILPIHSILWYGQTSFACFYLLFLYFYTNNLLIRGLSVALGFLIKPHFFLFPLILTFLRKEYRMGVYTLGFIFIFNLLPCMVWGVNLLGNYIDFLKSFSRTLYIPNQSFVPTVWQLINRIKYEEPMKLISPWGRFFLWITLLRVFIIGLLLFLYRKHIRDFPFIDFAFVIISVFLHNFLWHHYLILEGFLVLFFLKEVKEPYLLFPLFFYLIPCPSYLAGYILSSSTLSAIIVMLIFIKRRRRL